MRCRKKKLHGTVFWENMGNVKRMALSHPFFKVKKTVNKSTVFLGEGIFTMGLVKII